MNGPEVTARIVLTTAANPEEARRLAHLLVEEGLVRLDSIAPAKPVETREPVAGD